MGKVRANGSMDRVNIFVVFSGGGGSSLMEFISRGFLGDFLVNI